MDKTGWMDTDGLIELAKAVRAEFAKIHAVMATLIRDGDDGIITGMGDG